MEPEQEPGGDLEYQIEIDFWDAVRGAVKKLTITRIDTCDTCHGTGAVGSPQTCPTCGGTGTIQQAAGKMRFNVPCTRCGGTGKIRTVCPTCGGEGRLRRNETIDVRIPAGVASGSPRSRPRQRQCRNHGRSRRRFLFPRRREAASVLRTPRRRLYTKVPVDGGRSNARLKSRSADNRRPLCSYGFRPAPTAARRLRLKRKRCAQRRNGTRGDQYVEIQVVVPQPTDERVRNLMKELETIAPEDPRKDLFTKAGV